MECANCHRQMLTLGLRGLCDACVAADPTLYYSVGYLKLVEERLASAQSALAKLAERGIGSDRHANPTKGRMPLKVARADVKSLESTRSLIRSTLVRRGELAPTIDD